jgi:ribonucleoside-triphosphate reductase
MTLVIKRDGREQDYNQQKIFESLNDAASSIGVSLTLEDLAQINSKINEIIKDKEKINVEKLQDATMKALYICGFRKVRESYIEYRNKRSAIRETKLDIMKVIKMIGVNTDRDNANVGNNFSAKLLRIASESNKWQVLANMPKDLAKEHENLDLYYHDLDSYNLTINCLHVPTGKMLSKGFNTGYGTLNPPKRIETAAELSCILLQSCQNDMFGGQSHPDFDNDMAPFVESTRQEISSRYHNHIGTIIDHDYTDYIYENKASIEEGVEEEVIEAVHQAMQGVVYNLNTMHSRAGSQVPFSSINIGLPKSKDAALVCEIFLLEYEKGLGKGEQPIFPNIIFRVKSGVNRNLGDPYYYLYELACRVAAKRMNPTFMNMDADFNLKWYKQGIIPATMGCRTYLMDNVNGEPGVEGRGNIAPTTINLPRLGIKSMLHADGFLHLGLQKYEDRYIKLTCSKFLELFDEKIELAKDSLLHRYDVLKNLKVKDLPFVAGQGLMKGSENLGPDDSIESIIKQGTWGIGFIGLAETLIALTGKHHGESEIARDLGERIITHLREKCDEYKEKYKLNFSCYATPAEGLSGKFVPVDKEIYGIIPGVTDKEYYTNSFHVPVGYRISIKDKIEIEAPYHKMCNGGHISYVELDDYPDGKTIEKIVSYAYENTNISYIGANFHIRYCKNCGKYVHNENNCPACGSYDIQGISRVTGYLSLDERFGKGKEAEKKDRTDHNNKHVKNYAKGVESL